MKHIHIFSLIVYSLGISVAMAGGTTSANQFRSQWAAGALWVCGGHSLDNTESCIGLSARGNCLTWSAFARDYEDEFMLQMMVARKITANGAYFCPTQVEAKNRNKRNAWTEYASLGDSDTLCHWLCRDGYTGPECERRVSESDGLCDSTLMLRENYSALDRLVTGANIEELIPMFQANASNKCGSHVPEEHDTVLMITKWLPSGHGAWVRSMVVRALHDGWSDMLSAPAIYPASGSTEMLVCKNGYQPNSDKTNCIPINRDKCPESIADKLLQLCPGWNADDYDEDIHTFAFVDGCYQLRCKTDMYGFKDSNSRNECIPCGEIGRNGVSPSTGSCVACGLNTLFDAAERNAGYCPPATGYSKSDLMYGRGQTKNTQVLLSRQCWPLIDPEEYRKCVVNGGVSAADVGSAVGGFRTGGTSAPLIMTNAVVPNTSLPTVGNTTQTVVGGGLNNNGLLRNNLQQAPALQLL